MATADCRDIFAGIAAQVVPAYALVRTAEFSDVLGAVMVFGAECRPDGESRLHELHDKLVTLQATAADKYGPAQREIQGLSRVCPS